MLSTIQFRMSRLLSKNIKIKIHKTVILPADLQVCVRIGLLTILIIVQRDATQSSLFIILQVHSTCFGCQPHPSSGVHKTVTTASGTGHAVLCSYLPPTWPWPRWREVAAQKIWPVPEAAVTVLCSPDDGCGWHPKHVERTCRIIGCFVLHLVGQLLT